MKFTRYPDIGENSRNTILIEPPSTSYTFFEAVKIEKSRKENILKSFKARVNEVEN